MINTLVASCACTMCMQVAPGTLQLQCRSRNVPQAHQRLSSGGASSLLAAGCLMHTHTEENKQCKLCCCKSKNYTKHMTIYIGMQENAQCTRTHRSRSNAKCAAKPQIVQKKHMNIYIETQWNVNLQVATKAARKQGNIKMGFLNHSVFTLVFDEPADSVITSVANITTWCRSNWSIADCWLLISRYICIVGQCNKWTQW